MTQHPRVKEMLRLIPAYAPDEPVYQQFERLMSERRRAIEAQFRARAPHQVSTRRGSKSPCSDPQRGPVQRSSPASSTPGVSTFPPVQSTQSVVQTPKRQRHVRDAPSTAERLLDETDAEAAYAWAQLINAAAAADGKPDLG